MKFVELDRPKLNDMGIVSFSVKNKATKKYFKGVVFKVYIHHGKKVSTDELITGNYKTFDGKHHKAYVSLGTNILSVGKHKIVFKPISAKYKGVLTISITIKNGMAKDGKKYYTVSKGKLSRSTSIKH